MRKRYHLADILIRHHPIPTDLHLRHPRGIKEVMAAMAAMAEEEVMIRIERHSHRRRLGGIDHRTRCSYAR